MQYWCYVQQLQHKLVTNLFFILQICLQLYWSSVTHLLQANTEVWSTYLLQGNTEVRSTVSKLCKLITEVRSTHLLQGNTEVRSTVSKPALQTDHSKLHSQTLWVDNFCQLGKTVTVQMCFCSSIWLVDWCCQIEVPIVENFPQMIPGSLLRDTHNMPNLFPNVLFFHS